MQLRRRSDRHSLMTALFYNRFGSKVELVRKVMGYSASRPDFGGSRPLPLIGRNKGGGGNCRVA